MNHAIHKSAAWFVILTVLTLLLGPSSVADDASPTPSSAATGVPPELARRIGEITDAVLQYHIDPPARQQMLLGGLKLLYRASGQSVPAGLSRKVSSVATPEQLAVLLVDVWPKSPAKPVSAQALEDAMVRGLLGSVSGGGYLVSAKERKVAEQVAGNRYVGIQIALAMNDSEKLTSISEVFEGGPADRAGARNGDLIEKINGIETKGMELVKVVDRLRGDEGTEVTITVRQPKAKESRTLKMVRAAMPRTTVQGVRKTSSGDWDVRLDGPDQVGYLRITDIMASTPHELRKMAGRLENEGCRALVLDLRGVRLDGTAVHDAVLLADSLLDHGTIGRVRTVEREINYAADSDAILQGWPLAVLVDGTTSGTGEWLAVALKDNHRAILVGSSTGGPTARAGDEVRSTVPVADGTWSVNLVTGYLQRGDGRPLGRGTAGSLGVFANIVGALSPAEMQKDAGVMPDYTVAVKRPTENISSDPAVLKAVELMRQKGRKT